jgi:hypothetical protein
MDDLNSHPHFPLELIDKKRMASRSISLDGSGKWNLSGHERVTSTWSLKKVGIGRDLADHGLAEIFIAMDTVGAHRLKLL